MHFIASSCGFISKIQQIITYIIHGYDHNIDLMDDNYYLKVCNPESIRNGTKWIPVGTFDSNSGSVSVRDVETLFQIATVLDNRLSTHKPI